ncbi:MAG: hypothetical protein LBC74_01660 [Planctomycetaceae bacterium]|jgi:hypothetical protein|nr:hypothetical protein [Planctomycetaceae bacterium]
MENLGFITVVDHTPHGLIGGYLVLNQAGRPLEFHCTNPIKPSKTQEILFGIALEPYLYGEQIAKTLISKSKLKVVTILTNIVSVLAVNGLTNHPVAYIFDKLSCNPNSNTESESASKTAIPKKIISEELNESLRSFGIEDGRLQTGELVDGNEISPLPQVTGLDVGYWQGYVVGNRTVAIPGDQSKEREQLLNELKRISHNVDLLEPFTRIQLAIAETHNYS